MRNNNQTFQHKLQHILHCAAVNITPPGPPKFCCTDVTTSCTNINAINADVFVNMMLFKKEKKISDKAR